MKVKLLNEDADVLAEIESNTDLEGSIMIIDSLTSYVIDNEEYERIDKNIKLDTDTNSLEVYIEKI